MRDSIQGVFHFHSRYSHDGRSTLAEIASALDARGYSFCVMTEHFEDFTPARFERYLEEMQEVSATSGLIFIPGMEVNLEGVDTILFPATDYAEVATFGSGSGAGYSAPGMIKVVAHPSRYRFEDVAKHLDKFAIDGIEAWNQEADGRYAPPVESIERLKASSKKKQYQYYFGCDLHSAQFRVANVLSLTGERRRTPGDIVEALRAGEFVARNRETGIEYRNGADAPDFEQWAGSLPTGVSYQRRLRRSLRRCMRALYKSLPRNAQHSLNDVKNFVRNRV
jgi:hypothetical protein